MTTATKTCTVRSSTLGEYNKGHCGNANNCRYTGSSSAFVSTAVDIDGCVVFEVAFNRRWAAEDFAEWMNGLDSWDNIGDAVMVWAGSGHPTAAQWMRSDSAKEV